MIDLGTLGGLLERRHRLDAYCQRCDRWAELPLAALVAADHGSRRLPLTMRCQDCGKVGQLQVRQTVPMRGAGDSRRMDGGSPIASVTQRECGFRKEDKDRLLRRRADFGK